MGAQLREALRRLCFNTGWKYAVFWKLERQTQMMLTWEEAYYEKYDCSEKIWSRDMAGNIHEEYSHDALEVALLKMSSHAYYLGNGIIGKVALTGKHLWISADKDLIDSCSSLVDYNGWQIQLSAGIKTVAVVAIGKRGVVQLGSLNKIAENLKLVNCIQNAFSGLRDSWVDCITSVAPCSRNSLSCLSDISTNSGLEVFHGNMCNLDGPQTIDNNVLNVGQTEGVKLEKYGEQTSNLREKGRHGPLQHSFDSGTSLYSGLPMADITMMDILQYPSDIIDISACNWQHGLLSALDPPHLEFERDAKKNLGTQTGNNYMDELTTSFRFSAGCELYEALGSNFTNPSTNSDCNMQFKAETISDWDMQKPKAETSLEMTEVTNGSSSLPSSSADYLLEAVVANACCSESDMKTSKSLCKPAQSVPWNEKESKPSASDMCTTNSTSYSFGWSSLVEETSQRINSSETCGARSSRSSKDFSSLDDKLEMPQEPVKASKKRARPGESCRPRPRDRQLIQDRLKELRGLIPDGAKCSIDSLLERTIKHMLFMQSIIKHSDKLNKCGESKLLGKEEDLQGSSSYGKGSSWAVEVGNHLKVCPIMVENINMNGLMLVEMLCEECNHFLEIAEAVRSMGLTILKGVTQLYGEKTWMCFVVESQNNRSMHRMDVLWSLVQILQSKPET